MDSKGEDSEDDKEKDEEMRARFASMEAARMSLLH